LSGWLIRKASEIAGELTELYDYEPLSSLRFASLVFYDEQAAVFEIGPAKRKCRLLESAILNRSTANCIKLFTKMSTTVKDRLRRRSVMKKHFTHTKKIMAP
jgi:hypothetical protein